MKTMSEYLEVPHRIDGVIAEAIQRAHNHADELFVADERTGSLTTWTDGDFRVEVYGGLDHKRQNVNHGESIEYNFDSKEFKYANFTRERGWHTNRCLKEYVIETWNPLTDSPESES
jgi:hypothetical protein